MGVLGSFLKYHGVGESQLLDGLVLLREHGGGEGGDEVVAHRLGPWPAPVDAVANIGDGVDAGIEARDHPRAVHQPELNGRHHHRLVELEEQLVEHGTRGSEHEFVRLKPKFRIISGRQQNLEV